VHGITNHELDVFGKVRLKFLWAYVAGGCRHMFQGMLTYYEYRDATFSFW
jgi:hypothetical protein